MRTHTHAHTQRKLQQGEILLLDDGGQIPLPDIILQRILLSALNLGTVYLCGSDRENWWLVELVW